MPRGFTNCLKNFSFLYCLHIYFWSYYQILVYVNALVIGVILFSFILADLLYSFSLKDLGPLHYFLGIEATRTNFGFLLVSSKYITEILNRAKIGGPKPRATPIQNENAFPILMVTISGPISLP